jgi:hypothetical protein
VSDLIKSPRISIVGKKFKLLAESLDVESSDLESSDIALFLVSAQDGIVSADLEKWRLARDLYIPSMVIICDLTSGEIDFEDMTAISGKMLDPVVTPYLVLHSDTGAPVALIDLTTLVVIDYSNGAPVIKEAEPEHIDLVAEFRAEYLEDMEHAGKDGFAAGLLFPALPWIEGTHLGLDQIIAYLNQVPTIS